MPNLARSQRSAYNMIRRWGKSGFLNRAGAKRPCMIARYDYTPRERSTIALDGAERLRIAAYQLTVPPDFELDTIEWSGYTYKITKPPTGPRPDDTVMFYDCDVLRLEKII